MSLSFLSFAALFLGAFLLSFLDSGDDPVADDDADFTGTEDDDDLVDPLGGVGGTIDLLAGDDTLEASDQADTVFGGAGDDEIYALLYHDYISGGSGQDYVEGNYGNDTLEGGAGDDTLVGNADDDLLKGGDDDDLLQGGKDSDTLDGGAGDDTLEGGEGSDLLSGGSGDDLLNGTYGDGTLSNTVDEDLADTLDGGAGDDRLILGAGDTGSGGDGADAFALDAEIGDNGVAIITDFDPAVDRIELEVTGTADPSLLTIENFADDSGATVLYDGTAMADITGAQGLDPSAITLIQV